MANSVALPWRSRWAAGWGMPEADEDRGHSNASHPHPLSHLESSNSQVWLLPPPKSHLPVRASHVLAPIQRDPVGLLQWIRTSLPSFSSNPFSSCAKLLEPPWDRSARRKGLLATLRRRLPWLERVNGERKGGRARAKVWIACDPPPPTPSLEPKQATRTWIYGGCGGEGRIGDMYIYVYIFL